MSDYDSNKQSRFITYWDENSLYSWAISKDLPYSELEWLKKMLMLCQLMKKVI